MTMLVKGDFLIRLADEEKRCREQFEKWYSTANFPDIHDFCLTGWALRNLQLEDEDEEDE